MITEDYCSFEVAKLLKEKGFDEYCRSYYELGEPRVYVGSNGVCNNTMFQDESNECIARPTHQMAMKWLREKHNLHIEVIYNPYYEEYKSCMYKNIGEYNYTEFYSTYEEAVEAAIKYSLENLF